MHHFAYRQKYLFCEDVDIAYLAKKFGTPLYVYSAQTVREHFRKLKDAFSSLKPLICYSVKANSNLSILRLLVDQGAGLDIVSGGELFRALTVGCAPEKIVYASVGKTPKEIYDAIKNRILFFNIESEAELRVVNQIAAQQRVVVSVALRLNPDIEPKTHKFITTGKLTNKFGIDLLTAENLFQRKREFPAIEMKGLHLHIGSQITESAPFVGALKKIVSFIERLSSRGVALEYLNIGGGMGIVYHRETPQTAAQFAKKIIPILKGINLKLILEPGRFIVGSSGILVVKVLYRKQNPLKKFIIVDGGMNDLIRPALYDAYHQVFPVVQKKPSSRSEVVDIVGPICESGDFFAKARKVPYFEEGEYLALFGAGAYGFSMSSNYNSRPKPAEVLVQGKKTYLIFDRQSYSDLIANEYCIPIK